MLKRLLYVPCFIILTVTGQVQPPEIGSWTPKAEYYDLAEALKDPASVTALRLNRQGLTSVPSDISKFVNLVELDLSENEIADAGSSVPALSKLEKLNFSKNKLTRIPSSVCQLTKLKSLNLGNNQIASGSVGCLTSLEWIYLNNNSLTTVPDGLTGISSLRSVFLHSNQLTRLPEEFARMPKLESLLIQFNKIAEEPNAYKSTGIINYVFHPQLVSTRHLYKYMQTPAVYTNLTVDQLNQRVMDQMPGFATTENQTPGKLTNREKWERIGGYMALTVSGGWGTHRYFRQDDDVDLYEAFQLIGNIEYGKGNYAFGGYFSRMRAFYSRKVISRGSPIVIDGATTLVKAGLYFKYFFTPLSARFRPYIKPGVGFNVEHSIPEEYIRVLNLQARAGFDLYIFRFLAVNLETGFGGGNYVSSGWVFRFNSRKKA